MSGVLVPAEVWNVVQREGDSRPIVLIRPVGSEVALPILIDSFQASSIMLGMQNKRIEGADRPHTHDLFIEILDRLGVRLARIEITGLHGDTYYGRLVLLPGQSEDENQAVIIDSRPSDCIALAVRAKAPIYVDEELVNEEGHVYHVDGNSLTAASKDEDEMHLLQDRLKRAVEEEDYEQAALLRDQMKKKEEKP